jgi:soluble lytic murein transglycosylase-like protein
MRELPRSGRRRERVAQTGRRTLGLMVLSLLVAATSAGAQTSEGSARSAADAVRPSGSLFRKTLPFETEYLRRVAELALERRRTSEAEASTSAAGYASRYGISRDLAQRIISVARAEGVDPELAFRLIRVESRFVTRARGSSGSLGLTQLMPSTARSIDRSVNTEAEIMDPQTNLRLGFRYLRSMIERYRGDVRLALLAYNRGEGTVDRVLRSGRDPENGYSHLVLGTRSSNPYRGRGVLGAE